MLVPRVSNLLPPTGWRRSARHWTQPQTRRPGRPPTASELRRLIVRLSLTHDQTRSSEPKASRSSRPPCAPRWRTRSTTVDVSREELRGFVETVLPRLNEAQRRMADAMATALGRGGETVEAVMPSMTAEERPLWDVVLALSQRLERDGAGLEDQRPAVSTSASLSQVRSRGAD